MILRGNCVEGEETVSFRQNRSFLQRTRVIATRVSLIAGLGLGMGACQYWPPPPPIQQIQSCTAIDLNGAQLKDGVAAGFHYVTYGLRNISVQTCTVQGYPSLVYISLKSHPMVVSIKEGTDTYFSQQPELVTLVPGSEAYLDVRYDDIPADNDQSCPTTSGFHLTPPGSFGYVDVSSNVNLCSNSVTISPIEEHSSLAY